MMCPAIGVRSAGTPKVDRSAGADHAGVPMLEQTVQIVSNERDTDSYFRLVVRAPRIAPLIQPGQFAHVRVLPLKDALLRRPFSIFQVEGDTFSILYKTVGKGTEVLSRMQAGAELGVIAPLGHGFTVPKRGGETPCSSRAVMAWRRCTCWRNVHRKKASSLSAAGGAWIFCAKRNSQALGWDVRVTTEDGSHGEKGLVTQPLLAELKRRGKGRKLFACGPTGMLKAVGKIADELKVPAELSMDEHMCCGVGVCLTCVIPVKTDDGWEYQRTCTEGPVFDSRQVVWEVAK